MLNVAADAAAIALTSSGLSEEGIVGVLADDESAVGVPAVEEAGDPVVAAAAAAFSLRFASLSSSCCLSFSCLVCEQKQCVRVRIQQLL